MTPMRFQGHLQVRLYATKRPNPSRRRAISGVSVYSLTVMDRTNRLVRGLFAEESIYVIKED